MQHSGGIPTAGFLHDEWTWRIVLNETIVEATLVEEEAAQSFDIQLVERPERHAFKVLMAEYKAAIREITTKFENLDEDAQIRLGHSPIHAITSRLKTPESLYEKLGRKGFPATLEGIRKNIFDVAGVRVVCNYLEDVYTVENQLLSQRDVKLLQRKDYIENPKESGYRSLHLVVSVPVYLNGVNREVVVEVQLRTIAMDFWSSLEHALRYKNQWVLDSQSPALNDIRGRLRECAERISAIDQDMQHVQDDIAALMDEQGIKWEH